MMLATLLLAGLLPHMATSAYTIAYPSNATYAIDARQVEVIDQDRTYGSQPYRIMTTVYYPVGKAGDCQLYETPYWPNLTASVNAVLFGATGGFMADNATFESLRYQLCQTPKHAPTNLNHTAWPLALFSPGLRAVRQIYSAIATELASRGYIVITLDTPGQSSVVEYPDAPPIYANATGDGNTLAIPRTLDMLAVKRAALSRNFLRHDHFYRPDASRVVAWGHSLGGAASADVLLADNTVSGGINIDGGPREPANSTGVTQPFMIFSHDPNVMADGSNYTVFWNRSTGPELQLGLFGTTHDSLSDAPLVAKTFGIDKSPGIISDLGTVDGRRIVDILGAYADAWFQYCFSGRVNPGALLRGPSPQYPEVAFNLTRLDRNSAALDDEMLRY